MVRDVGARLVHGDLVELEAQFCAARLRAGYLAEAIREYPAHFVVPPPGQEPALSVVALRDAEPPAWSVNVPLWSVSEGRSDLTLQLTVAEIPGGGFSVEIDDLHVL